MALSKEQKNQIVTEVSSLLDNSKMTVIAQYQGTSVGSLQALRAQARENNTRVRVIKNRLVRQAMAQSEKFQSSDSGVLTGQLMYAFNPEDEVAAAQVLADFAKNEPQITFVGAFDSSGQFISSDEVTALSMLPSKDSLRAMLAGAISAPNGGLVNVLAGSVRGVLNALHARAENLGKV